MFYKQKHPQTQLLSLLFALVILFNNKENVVLVTSFKSITIPSSSLSLNAFSGQHATDSYYKKPFDNQAPKVPHDRSLYKEPHATDTFNEIPFNAPNNCHSYKSSTPSTTNINLTNDSSSSSATKQQISSSDNYSGKNKKQNYNYDKKQLTEDKNEWGSYVMVDQTTATINAKNKQQEHKDFNENNDRKEQKKQQPQQLSQKNDNNSKNKEHSSYVMAKQNSYLQRNNDNNGSTSTRKIKDNEWDDYIKGKKIKFTNQQRTFLLEKAKYQERTIYPGNRFESSFQGTNENFRSIAFRRSSGSSTTNANRNTSKKERKRLEDTRKNSRINNNNLNFSNDPSLQEAIDFSRRINSEFSRINNNNIDSNEKDQEEIMQLDNNNAEVHDINNTDDDTLIESTNTKENKMEQEEAKVIINDNEKSEIKNNDDENTEQKKEQFVNNILQSMNANNKLEDKRFATATQVDNNSQNFQDTTNSFGRRRRQSNNNKLEDERFGTATQVDNNTQNFQDTPNSFGRRRRQSNTKRSSFDARRNSQLTDTNENYFKDSSSFRDDRRPSKQQQRSYRIDDSTLLRNRMNTPFIESNGAQQLSSPQKVLTRQQQKNVGMKRSFATDLETRLESITDNKYSKQRQEEYSYNKRNIYDDDVDNYNKDLEEDVLKSLVYDDVNDGSTTTGSSRNNMETTEENDKTKLVEERMYRMEAQFNKLLDRL